MDFVIPVALEMVTPDADFFKFLVAHLAPLGILALVEPSMDLKSLRRLRGTDQIHHDLMRL